MTRSPTTPPSRRRSRSRAPSSRSRSSPVSRPASARPPTPACPYGPLRTEADADVARHRRLRGAGRGAGHARAHRRRAEVGRPRPAARRLRPQARHARSPSAAPRPRPASRPSAARSATSSSSAVGMTGTVVVTVGKAAAQRDKLSWWESRPLYGWKVLVPAHQGAGRRDERPAARLRRGAGRGADHRRRAAAHARPRWSARSRAWSPAGSSGSCSPRPTRCARCARSSRSSASTRARSPA